MGDAPALLSATFFAVANVTIVRGTAPGDDDNGAFVSLLLTAFIGRVFGYASVQLLGAMRASASKRMNPFFAVALGVGVLGERLTPAVFLAALLGVAGTASIILH